MMRRKLTRQERLQLRQRIDALIRTELPIYDRCVGCGASYESWTAGCEVCNGRWQNRHKRGKISTAEYLQLCREKHSVALSLAYSSKKISSGPLTA